MTQSYFNPFALRRNCSLSSGAAMAINAAARGVKWSGPR